MNVPESASPAVSAEAGAAPADEANLDDVITIPLDWKRWWLLLPEVVAIVCAGGIGVLVGIDVVSRYTNWYRVPWVEDIIKIMFLWIVFLGGAIAVKHDAHVRMDLLSHRLVSKGPAGRLWGEAIRYSPAAMGVILLVQGMRIVEIHMRRELTWLEIPAGYFSTIIPLSGALLIVYTLGRARQRPLHKVPEKWPDDAEGRSASSPRVKGAGSERRE